MTVPKFIFHEVFGFYDNLLQHGYKKYFFGDISNVKFPVTSLFFKYGILKNIITFKFSQGCRFVCDQNIGIGNTVKFLEMIDLFLRSYFEEVHITSKCPLKLLLSFQKDYVLVMVGGLYIIIHGVQSIPIHPVYMNTMEIYLIIMVS